MGRYKQSIGFLESLLEMDVELGGLLALDYAKANNEIAAVKTLYKCQINLEQQNPALLKAQAEFLWRSKGRPELAETLLQYALEADPSDVKVWLWMSEIYLDREDFPLALTTLNSCPFSGDVIQYDCYTSTCITYSYDVGTRNMHCGKWGDCL